MTASEFIKSLPAKASAEALEDMDTNFFFDLEGEGGGQYTLVAHDGQLHLHEGRYGEPKCEVKAKADNFMKVIRGDINPMMAVMTGKLKISNTGELLKYAKVFGLM
jgi:putative sterol carrier protein